MNWLIALIVFVGGICMAGYIGTLFPMPWGPMIAFFLGMPVGTVAMYIAMDDSL